PGAAEAAPAPAGDFATLLAQAPPDDAHMKYILPVNRSGWAIAAGYVGLFSFFPVISYFGVLVSLIGAWHLRKNPKKLGWGRGFVRPAIPVPSSLIYTAAFLSH